nr:copper chaperone PCu(A)C [Dietzia cinnamea]
MEDAWVKSTDVNGGTDHGEATGDPGPADPNAHGDGGAMAPVFEIVRNQSDEDVRLVEVASVVSGEAELHETVSGTGGSMMREREGGFVIPAGGELVFEPGGNHIMLMGVHESIRTGQEVAVTLTLENGDSSEIVASARSFEGGNEQYQGGE